MRSSFDLSAYKAPRGEQQRLGITNVTTLKSKTKRVSYIDDLEKVKKHIPSPDKYIKNVVWCDAMDFGSSRPKGKFMMDPKVTSTEDIFKS